MLRAEALGRAACAAPKRVGGQRRVECRLGVFVPAGSGGLSAPVGLVFGPDQNLYVGSRNTASVLRYDGRTGAFLGTFAQGGGLSGPDAMTFGPDGDLYVTSRFTSQVLRFDGATGAFKAVLVDANPLSFPGGIAFGPDKNLYVVSRDTAAIYRYDGATGAPLGTFATLSDDTPFGLAWGPDGNAYVTGLRTSTVLRLNGTTGALIDVYVGAGAGLQVPTFLTWVPRGQPPVAVAAASTTVHAGTVATLDGAASHDDRTPSAQLQYAWTLVSAPAGSHVTLANPTTPQPTLSTDAVGKFVAQLIVTDADGNASAPATVTIDATNTVPIADAGAAQSVKTGTTVQLDGSASADADGDALGHSWVFVSKPTGSAATISSSSAVNATFTADVEGTYTLGLVVSDPFSSSPQATVVVTATTPIITPPTVTPLDELEAARTRARGLTAHDLRFPHAGRVIALLLEKAIDRAKRNQLRHASQFVEVARALTVVFVTDREERQALVASLDRVLGAWDQGKHDRRR